MFDKLHTHALKNQEIQRTEIHEQYSMATGMVNFDKVLRQDGSLGRSNDRKPSPNRPRFNAVA